MKKIILILVLTLISFISIAQRIKIADIKETEIDFNIAIVENYKDADIWVYKVYDKKETVSGSDCFWYFLKPEEKKYDYVVKIIPFENNPDFVVFFTKDKNLAFIRSEELRKIGLKGFLKRK